MSQKSDVFLHFCNDIYKNKMTVEERAELMVDLYQDLDYEDYDLIDEYGKYQGINIELAIAELKFNDEKNNEKYNNQIY